MSESPPGETAARYHERVLAVLLYIQKHLDDDLDLDTLAAVAHFSPFHFHRVFSGLLGEGVKEHVRRLRLERAAHRLKFTDEQIVRVALDAGFQTHESFTRAFTAMFAASPSRFRARHRSVAYPPAPSGVHYAVEPDDLVLAPAGRNTVNVSVEKLLPTRVAFVRHTGPYAEVGSAWGRLMAWAGRRGLLDRPPEIFGLCYDDQAVTPAGRVRYDACLVVGDGIRAEGEVGVQEVAGGEFAVAVHTGPYQTVGNTYAALCGQWVAAGGRQLGDPPSVEVYLNDPRSTPPAELRTKVCLRLA